MNKRKNKLILGVALIVGFSFDIYATDTINNNINAPLELLMKVGEKEINLGGQQYSLNTPPIIASNRVLLPLRFVTENMLDANVEYDTLNKKITITKRETKVELTIGEGMAIVNGKEVSLDQPPIVKDDTTLVPVRFISESFGLVVNYDVDTKEILIKSDKHLDELLPDTTNIKPVADFMFGKNEYIEGNTILVNNMSYDMDGSIIKYEWTLRGKGSSSDVNALLKNLSPGNHTLVLKVQDNEGVWSDPVAKDITIIPNRAPEIVLFKSDKESYAKGEPITFTYSYDNEEGEGIVNERWRYYKDGESISQAVVNTPKVIFSEGIYNVVLEITDEFGKVSEAATTQIRITGHSYMSEWEYHFTNGTIGTTIDNYDNVNYRTYKDLKVNSLETNNDKLWMSDSPELVSQDGVLYRDELEGNARVVLHHISGYDNETSRTKKIMLVIENKEDYTMAVNISKKSIKGPVPDVLYLGQDILFDFWKSNQSEQIILEPGQRKVMYDSGDRNWLNGYCISGILDIETQGNVEISTISTNKYATIYDLDELPLLPKGTHIRGTFDGTLRDYKIDIDDSEPTKIVLGEDTDEWVKGIDGMTGNPSENKGNFGVTYRFTLTAKEDTGVFLNPRADIFRGAIKWKDTGAYLAPSDGFFIGQNRKAILLGVIKAGETRTLEYMLPNGSSAPVILGFVPKSDW